MTTLLVVGSFFIGMAVGIVLEDAWDLLRSSRKDHRMWKPQLPRFTVLHLLIMVTLANAVLGVLLITTRVSAERLERENLANAVVNCENANESRAANLSLWNFVLDLSAANREEEPSPAEQKRLDDFRAWVTALFAARDCSDLSRVYEIPPPPTLTP